MKILLALLMLSFNAQAALVQLEFQGGFSIEFDNQIVEIQHGPDIPGLDDVTYIYDEAALRIGNGDSLSPPIPTASENSEVISADIWYVDGFSSEIFFASQQWTDPLDGVSKSFRISAEHDVEFSFAGDVVGFFEVSLNENSEFYWSLSGFEDEEIIDSGTAKLASVNVSAVPVPAAFWMFGTALACLVPRLKRKNA